MTTLARRVDRQQTAGASIRRATIRSIQKYSISAGGVGVIYAEQAGKEIAATPRVRRRSDQPGVPDELVQKAIDAFGKIDIIINNALHDRRARAQMSDEHFQAMLDIHTVVPFRVIRAARRTCASRPRRSARKGARCSARSSTSPPLGAFATPARPTTRPRRRRGGAHENDRQGVGQFKVNVNAVAFGFIDTRLRSRSRRERHAEGRRDDPAGDPRADAPDGLGADPARPPATPEEAAGAIFFLCSPVQLRARQTLHVTGGISAACRLGRRGPAGSPRSRRRPGREYALSAPSSAGRYRRRADRDRLMPCRPTRSTACAPGSRAARTALACGRRPRGGEVAIRPPARRE